MAEPTAADKLEALKKLAGPNATLEDQQVLAETLKSLAEYDKATVEAKNQNDFTRFEFVKTWTSGAVPFLTLLTLLATIVFQWMAADSSSLTSEDNRWKTVVETMAKPPGPTIDLVVVTGLTPFFTSDRYRAQANDTMILMASRLADSLAFDTLLQAAFRQGARSDLPLLHRLDYVVRRNLKKTTEVEEWMIRNPPPQPMAMRPPPQMSPFPSMNMQTPTDVAPANSVSELPPLKQLEEAKKELALELAIIARRVSELLRKPASQPAEKYDLSGLDLTSMNLENADLRGIDIRNAHFDGANVKGAILNPTAFSGSTWAGTMWWQADIINADLLKYLITSYLLDEAAESGFRHNKKRLCAHASTVCARQ